VPLPLPFAPDVTVIQDAVLCAVHEQPVADDTDTVPVVALAETDVALGEIV
jgi:hypothetical protein